ncbi:hypothetical protein NPIL_595672 [Nephila pilipes]|uniref:Uncharacterized protein n=1 Tax=Nephila pilipes TaxID=299642 RepID=A0A8X6Q6C9_NEPPI|nr:hypothetical protein NPIL_595672 [Nephila pilipes]
METDLTIVIMKNVGHRTELKKNLVGRGAEIPVYWSIINTKQLPTISIKLILFYNISVTVQYCILGDYKF